MRWASLLSEFLVTVHHCIPLKTQIQSLAFYVQVLKGLPVKGQKGAASEAPLPRRSIAGSVSVMSNRLHRKYKSHITRAILPATRTPWCTRNPLVLHFPDCLDVAPLGQWHNAATPGASRDGGREDDEYQSNEQETQRVGCRTASLARGVP